MITSAALCPAPPLLAREVTGLDPVVPELREACREAVAALTATEPDLIAVVGVADQTLEWSPQAPFDLLAYAPGLAGAAAGAPGGPVPTLPLGLGLGLRLLDQAGYAGPRALHAVSAAEPSPACAGLGGKLAAASASVGLLVLADGGARRGLKAPGYLDERCAPFDAAVEAAVAAGDLAALLALDASLAAELMATGRAAWQVMAGGFAAGTGPVTGLIRYSGDPFGVAYLVASLTAGAPPG